MTDRHGWAEVPAPTGPSVRRRSGGAGWRVLVGPVTLLGVAVVQRLTHHPRRAVMAVIAAAVLALVLVASRTARRRLDVLVRRATPVVAGGLGWLLLAPLYYLVVTPLGLLLRAVGEPPLDLGHDPDRVSYWSVRAPGRPSRPTRMFADERGWHPAGFSPRQRRRLVLRTVVAVVAIEAMVAGGFLVVERRNRAEPGPVGVSTMFTGERASLRGPTWVDDALAEQRRLTAGIVYTSFTGATLRDFDGRYFDVRGRVRESYRSPLAATRRPVEVWFFGGSTMFGFDLQRDEHTIPSEVVRLAEDRGIAIEARNFGMAGYVNYQEAVLLSLLVTGGERPDLAVFYDGTNDLAMALLDAFGELNPRGEPGDLGSIDQRRALADRMELPDATADPPSPLGLRPGTKPVTVDGVVGDAVGVYGQGIDLSRALADRHGFRLAHFWQPDLYTKRPLDPEEVALFPAAGLDPVRYGTMARLSARVRRTLPPGVVDISDALDHLSGPILSDNVHTNERGARAVAEAMYRHLAPELESLSAAR